MDEEQFRESFEDFPRLEISSGNEVESELMKISTILSNPGEDWEKRVEQVSNKTCDTVQRSEIENTFLIKAAPFTWSNYCWSNEL